MSKRKSIIFKILLFNREYSFSLDYFYENWGAIFIIIFQVLLVTCAFFLVKGYEGVSNQIAIYAFYSLVVGVFLQFASYMKYGGEKETE